MSLVLPYSSVHLRSRGHNTLSWEKIYLSVTASWLWWADRKTSYECCCKKNEGNSVYSQNEDPEVTRMKARTRFLTPPLEVETEIQISFQNSTNASKRRTCLVQQRLKRQIGKMISSYFLHSSFRLLSFMLHESHPALLVALPGLPVYFRAAPCLSIAVCPVRGDRRASTKKRHVSYAPHLCTHCV